MAKVDQRGFDNQRPEFLESGAAAAFLGVQARTLYAYASRGLIAPVRAGRRSRYARADLERLKTRHDARAGHGPVAGSALHWGEPVLETRISTIGPEGPCYRGHLALALAREGRSFRAVCHLLWTGALDDGGASAVGKGAPPAAATASGRRTARTSPAPASRRSRGPSVAAIPDPIPDPILALMDVALSGLRRRSAPFGLAPALELARARALLLAFAQAAAGTGGRRAVTVTAAVTSGGDADPAALLLAGLGGAVSPARRRLVDAALILCADHELNASTFAARVAASTGADLQACLLAALATFLGPRHGAASRSVELLLDPLAGPAQAERAVRERTTRGEGMPGFGHPLYPGGDPRATALLALVAGARSSPRLRTLHAVIAATFRLRGERPNIDAALVAVTLALGWPRGAAAALFAVGRTAGWVAHVLEQRQSTALLRPRALYLGAAGPAEDRS